MRSFILTDLQAGKLPRWALPLLCLLYALPGFIGRDPWRMADATGFGVALTMARGGLADWLMPNVFGEPVYSDGPVSYALAALAVRALPWLPAHVVVRGFALVSLATLFVAVWYATYRLARRPGIQPSDPFGASVSRVDFGRAIADSALLVLLGTIGLIARVHETTADAAQVTLVACYLYGMAGALDRPGRGAIVAGCAAGLSLACGGGVGAWLAMVLGILILPGFSPSYRLVRERLWAIALPLAIGLALVWPLALLSQGTAGTSHLSGWFETTVLRAVGPGLANARYLLDTLPWFFWPAWPMVAWSIWRWRGQFGEPAVALPLAAAGLLLLPALLSPRAGESLLLPLVPPLAMLAAVGLPTIRRATVSLVDWFSVSTFTLMGLAIWVYWIAWITGFPPTMAFKASQLAPDFRPGNLLDEIVLGLAATVAWLALVRWRVSRQPRMIWRAVMLSSAGLVLTWFLLMTLWLPMFNERNTYRDIGQAVGRQIPDGECVGTRRLNLTSRASIAYFGEVQYGGEDSCPWLLIEDHGPLVRMIAPQEPGWRRIWEGARPSDRDERFRLYRRVGR